MKALLKPRNEQIVEKAKNGDGIAALTIAKLFYKGKRTLRSLPLARYWCFKSIQYGNEKAKEFYHLVFSPHFTGNEIYKQFGKQYGFSIFKNLLISSTFKGKYDKLESDERLYRTYHIVRLLVFVFPEGAYRVFEQSSGSYRILGKEYAKFNEYYFWLLFDLLIIAGIILLNLFG